MRNLARHLPAVGIAAAYYLTARLGLMLAIEPGYATGLWPPAGIALAGALAFGRRALPGVWLGSFLANALPPAQGVHSDPITRMLLMPALIGMGAAAQAAAGAWLVGQYRDSFPLLASVRNVVLLLLIGPLSCIVNSTVSVTLLVAAGIVTPGQAGVHWWTWWLGDAAGVVLVTPLLLAWSVRPRRIPTSLDALWALFVLVLTFLVGQIVFREWTPLVPARYPITFLPMPLAIWAAYQFGAHGATASGLLLAIIATTATLGGLGPFADWPPNESVLLVQSYTGMTMAMNLILTAAVCERDRADESTRRSKAQMGAILKSSLDSIITIDRDGCVVELNPATERLFGYTRAEMTGRPLADLIIPPDSREAHRQGLERVVRTGKSIHLGQIMELTAVNAKGRKFSVELVISKTDMPEGPMFTGHIRDITQRKLAEKQLRHHATHDALTGAANRVLLLDRLRSAITSEMWQKDYRFAVIYLDVNGFKAVNDNHGHAVGDLLLVSLVDRLRGCLRENDLVARIGGDEFVILLDGLVSEEEAAGIVSRIETDLAKPYRIESHELCVTASHGFVSGKSGLRTPEEIIREADRRMYESRRQQPVQS